MSRAASRPCLSALWAALVLLASSAGAQAGPSGAALTPPPEAGDAAGAETAIAPAPAPPAAVEAPAPVAREAAAAAPAEVRVGDSPVFTLSVPRGGSSPEARARRAASALAEAVEHARPDDVRVEHGDAVSIVYVDQTPVVQLTQADAQAAGDSGLTVHADRVAAEVRKALKAEQRRSAVANTLFSVSLAVLFTLLAVLLARRAWQLGDHAEGWLERNAERVPALTLRSVEVMNRGAVRGALALLAVASRWVALLGLAYAWLFACLSLFEATRPLTRTLSSALLRPLTGLASRLAAGIPLLVILFFAGLVLALVLRAVRLFFAEAARGSTRVAWLPRDLAAPAGVLAQLGLVLVTLVLFAPVITGDPDGAFTRIGLVLLVACGLATVPVVSVALVGAVTLFGRRLPEGAWVEVRGRAGRVTHVGLLEATLRDAAGVEHRVPHLARLWHPTRVHGPTPRVTARVTVDRALATPALAARVQQAIAHLGAGATAQLAQVDAATVTLELAVSSDAPDARATMLWLALGELESARRGSG
jgi:hypothetical protein